MFTSICQKTFKPSNPCLWKLTDRSFLASRTTSQRVLTIKQLKAMLSITGQLFSNIFHRYIIMDNSKNPLLHFGTRVVERSDIVKVPFSDAQKSFFEFLSIVQLPFAFFDSRLVPLINYAIGPSTLNRVPKCHFITNHASTCRLVFRNDPEIKWPSQSMYYV